MVLVSEYIWKIYAMGLEYELGMMYWSKRVVRMPSQILICSAVK